LNDDDQKRLRAELQSNPAFSALRDWAHEQRDKYLANLAQTIWTNPDIVTETALREKAAFFRGMNVVLNQPFFSARALKDEVERKDTNESA
jgi:ATP-dependent helicase YprA (DUF1998 family)